MARIRIDLAQGAVPRQRAQRQPVISGGLPIVNANEVDPATAAMARAASDLNNLAEAERRAAEAAGLSHARVGLARRLGELEEEFRGRDMRDSTAAAEEFRTRSAEIIGELGGSMSRNARRVWEADAGALLESRVINVRRDAFERHAQGMRAQLQDNLRELGTLAAGARNPVERQTNMEMADRALADAVAAGYINPQQEQQLRRGFQSDISTAEVTRLMAANPGAALALLRDPNRTPGLDVDRRAALEVQALNRQDALAARADAALARREAQVRNRVSAIDGLLSAGIVPADQIAEITALARGTSMESIIPRMVEDARTVGRFAALPAAQQVTELQAIQSRVRAGNATDADLAQAQRLQGIVVAQQRDLDQNGIGRGIRDGIIEPLPALDPANPATLNARVEAAQTLTQHYGRPVSPFTREDVEGMVQSFVQASPDQRMATLRGVMAIQDPAVRAEAIRHLERARGDAGRLPAGALARVMDIARVDERQATRLLESLTADVDQRVRAAGEAANMRTALDGVMSSGVQGVRAAQARLTGDARWASVLNRDLDMIRRVAAVDAATGMDVTEAVTGAAGRVNAGLATLSDSSLAQVYFPAGAASPQDVRTGLRQLREQTVAGITIPEGETGAGDAARRRLAAARGAVWVNEGNRFVLIAQDRSGSPAVLAEATLADVQRAARAAPPPPMAPAVGTGQEPPAPPRTGMEDRAARAREIIDQRRQQRQSGGTPPALQ
jgi:hypothetical protein